MYAIKTELLNSEKLQQHWELHPNEVMLLRHATAIVARPGESIVQNAMDQAKRAKRRRLIKQNKFLPDYLQTNMLDMPQTLRDAQAKRRRDRALFYAKRARQREERKENDPLRQKKNKKGDNNKKLFKSNRNKKGGAFIEKKKSGGDKGSERKGGRPSKRPSTSTKKTDHRTALQ